MQFATPDHDSITLLLYYSQIHIGIGLFGRPLETLSFHVGLSAASDQIVFLEICKPLEKIFVILSAAVVLLIRLKTCRVNRVDRICSHATLNAHSAGTAQGACHVLFVMQILRILMNMAKTINGFSGEMRFGGAKLPEFGDMRSIESKPHNIQGGKLFLVIPVNLTAVKVKIPFHLPKTFNVLILGSHLCLLSRQQFYCPKIILNCVFIIRYSYKICLKIWKKYKINISVCQFINNGEHFLCPTNINTATHFLRSIFH